MYVGRRKSRSWSSSSIVYCKQNFTEYVCTSSLTRPFYHPFEFWIIKMHTHVFLNFKRHGGLKQLGGDYHGRAITSFFAVF